MTRATHIQPTATCGPPQHSRYIHHSKILLKSLIGVPSSVLFSSHTFSAKERDLETGYSYFGAQYYNATLSTWLSVDPLSDKYPSMSDYMYCAGNPVMLIDPDGREIDDPPIISGDENKELHITMRESFQQLVDYLSEVNFAEQNNISHTQEGLEIFASIVLDNIIEEDPNLVPDDRPSRPGLTMAVSVSFEDPDNPDIPDGNIQTFVTRRPIPEATPWALNPGLPELPLIPFVEIGDGTRIFFVILVVVNEYI